MLRGGPSGGSGATARASRDTDPSVRFSKQFNDFILDLGDEHNVQYEEEYFPEYASTLRHGSQLLARLRAYQDASNEIRAAISNPTADNEEAAWRKLAPSVLLLKDCFDNAKEMERFVPVILEQLCGQVSGQVSGDPNANTAANRNRGLARSFADMMQYAFDFDALKSSIPAIQNDFSYYRRTLSRMQKSQDAGVRSSVLSGDVSNHMSLFYAYHNPMVKTVVDSANSYVKESGTSQYVLECLSVLAAGSLNAVKQHKISSVENNKLCVQVLVTCCILYDWISPHGVNSAQSTIDAKAVLQLVRERPLVDSRPADEVLRFNCRTIR
ncbi:hypothetical protein GGI12_002181 [Dipsacomyces acuminosporus]|nr:hypothetical protein GGI12_002181 [Dipsacomyces acuminosporus]